MNARTITHVARQTADKVASHRMNDTSKVVSRPLSKALIKKLVFAAIFVVLALFLASVVPSIEIAWVTSLLMLTIYLFAFEVVDVDIAAISIMVLLGLSSLFFPVMGLDKALVDSKHLFDGFSIFHLRFCPFYRGVLDGVWDL